MDAMKFIEERKRLCGTHDICKDCPANRNSGCMFDLNGGADADEQVNFLEEWVAAHPRKTRQSEFLKMLPNVPLNDKGQPAFCPKLLDTEYHPVGSCCLDVDICQRCMDNFWLAEVEDA